MDIKDMNPQNFADLFSAPKTDEVAQQLGANFGGGLDTNANLFDSTTDTTTVDSTTDTTTVAASTEDTSTESPDPDILGDDEKKPGRKPKYDFSDAKGYFADRIKSGKFVAIEETGDDGKSKQFIPQTPEEFDEVIDIQVNYQLEQRKKELEQSWYADKSPAWKAVAKYAEMVEDPTEILPFIQGIKTIESVSELNEEEADGAERIIRARLEQRGDSKELIDEQIEALKTSDRLVSTAKKYKPLILQEEQQALARELQERRRQEAEYRQLVDSVRENAIKAIEAPIFGKNKLKQEEKAAVYELIAQPNSQSRGYAIFDKIDELFEKGDFDTLKQVALLLTKKDAFIGYISNSAADKTAEGIQRRLRAATDSRGSGHDNYEPEKNKPVVKREQYSVPRFGRG